MGILRRIETGLEKAFEGGFGRTFKSHVQPPEIARKLRKEMDDHRTISVSQVYVPNIYTVFLAPTDREQFATYEASLRTELAAYLGEYARREGYTLPGRVRVVFESADELEVGLFGIAIATEEDPHLPEDDLPPGVSVPRDEPAPAPPIAAAIAPDPSYEPEPLPAPAPSHEPEELPEEFRVGEEDVPAELHAAAAPPQPVGDGETSHLSADDARRAGLVRDEWALSWRGGEHVIERRALTLGRGRDCDVVLDDRNVSRHHAELVRHGDGFVLRDLDSTNGSAVNGRRVRQADVKAGDVITLGTVTLRLEQRR
jgi:hypothetical protein